jgi:hypothetical protein
LKTRAREELAERDVHLVSLQERLDEQAGQLKAAQDAIANAPSERELEELSQLRTFRDGVALDDDPTFKQRFDTPIDVVDAAICTKLKEVGVKEEDIVRLREVGISDLNWDQFFESAPWTKGAERFVQLKLAQREDLQQQRTAALVAARTNAAEFRAQTQREEVASITSALEAHVKRLPDFNLVLPKDASAAQQAEHQNAKHTVDVVLAEARGLPAQIGKNPALIGELVAAHALGRLMRLQLDASFAQLQSAEREQTAAVAAKQAELDKAQAEIGELTDRLAALERSGSPFRQSETPVAPKPATHILEQTAGQAVDAHFKGRGVM